MQQCHKSESKVDQHSYHLRHGIPLHKLCAGITILDLTHEPSVTKLCLSGSRMSTQ